MKHIKMRGKLIDHNTKVEITILEQTHRRGNFGNIHQGCAFTHNGKQLYSANVPGTSVSYPHSLFFVRGSEASSDGKKSVVDVEDWKWIKELVEEYNLTYKE